MRLEKKLQNDKKRRKLKSSHWAVVVTMLYVVIIVAAMMLVSFDMDRYKSQNADIIYVEITEPKPPVRVEPPKRVREAPRHEHMATTDNTQQVSGTDENTRTVNPRAMFHMNKGGADEPENAGNPYAAEDKEDKASGTGGGLNPSGNDMLDEGLQGRGLRGALPLPEYPAGNRSGKVVVRVTVDRAGNVTNAIYDLNGSTTNDAVLVEAALKAARCAKFTESKAFLQGGTITYVFKMK